MTPCSHCTCTPGLSFKHRTNPSGLCGVTLLSSHVTQEGAGALTALCKDTANYKGGNDGIYLVLTLCMYHRLAHLILTALQNSNDYHFHSTGEKTDTCNLPKLTQAKNVLWIPLWAKCRPHALRGAQPSLPQKSALQADFSVPGPHALIGLSSTVPVPNWPLSR